MMTNNEVLALFTNVDAQIKELPRTQSGEIELVFQANGQWYKRIEVEKMSINRFNIYNKLSVQFGFAKDLNSFFREIAELENSLNELAAGDKTQYVKAATRCAEIKRCVSDLTEARYAQALYICTIFIVTPDEDLHFWTFQDAEIKIGDWIKEGYGISDFLSLAACFVPQYLKLLKQDYQA